MNPTVGIRARAVAKDVTMTSISLVVVLLLVAVVFMPPGTSFALTVNAETIPGDRAVIYGTVLDQDGKPLIPILGCYGMGLTRLVAAIIEQNHDEVGIKWPAPVAPFMVHIVARNNGKSDAVREAADALYQTCLDQNMEVLLDDTDDRPGVKFADADLIGIPHRITVGDRALKEGNVEYKARSGGDAEPVPLADILSRITQES